MPGRSKDDAEKVSGARKRLLPPRAADAEGHPFSTNLDKNPANYAPLTPISLLSRAAVAFGSKSAVIDGERDISYLQLHERCCRLASSLAQLGIEPLDTVAILAPNIPEMIEAHFAVPMLGAVLNPLNIRLDPATIAFSLSHGMARVLIVDPDCRDLAASAIALLPDPPLIVEIGDSGIDGAVCYDALIDKGAPDFTADQPLDEWQSLCLLYTSGTTGDPKGAVYSHRAAYLQALSNAIAMGIDVESVYLWTLPMFHCSGWCFPWANVASGATQICLRKVDAKSIFRLIAEYRVTHLCGAPTVFSMIAHAPETDRVAFEHRVQCAVGGAAPSSTIISAMEKLGFCTTQVYGLTETYGPAIACIPIPEWRKLPDDDRYSRVALQGGPLATIEGVKVVDPESCIAVPQDGATIGEVWLRGNGVMKGYFRNPEATEREFARGWFHSGDLAVWHRDGFIEIKDRAKDIIISGGENISSLEVEEALARHPATLFSAVVASPDAYWGEVPCAFIELKPGQAVPTAAEMTAFCREHLAHYKVPSSFVFGVLPKTSTGKIQKFVLRQLVRNSAAPNLGTERV